jgi:hypothetical protein
VAAEPVASAVQPAISAPVAPAVAAVAAVLQEAFFMGCTPEL